MKSYKKGKTRRSAGFRSVALTLSSLTKQGEESSFLDTYGAGGS